jgi:hypothetical protein
MLSTTLSYKVCQGLATGQWFSPSTLVSSTSKTDSHDIAEILLKVALCTITLTLFGVPWDQYFTLEIHGDYTVLQYIYFSHCLVKPLQLPHSRQCLVELELQVLEHPQGLVDLVQVLPR